MSDQAGPEHLSGDGSDPMTASWSPEPRSRTGERARALAAAGDWQEGEFSEIFEHQLATSLEIDLFPRSGKSGAGLAEAAANSSPLIRTFRDLLLHPTPPEPLLRAASLCADELVSDAGMLPAPVARAFAASVSAARLVHQHLEEESVSGALLEVQWLAGTAWAPDAVRQLAREAVEVASGRGAGASAGSGSARVAPEAGLQGAPTLDGYRVTGRLGEGGMGVVWRAVQLSTGRTVALKLMSSAAFGSQRGRLRFEREVRLAARLEHPQIARVYDSGLNHGAYYYAMELVDGRPLDQFAAQRALDARGRLKLVQQICVAVEHAHQGGIVHRDLKPGNILVDGSGTPHILDFGLAKALQDAQTDIAITSDGDFTGTPAYMAPEQASGTTEACDTRTDVYSLGVILFQLLSGALPHDVGGTKLQVLRRIAETEPRRLSDVQLGIDPALDRLLQSALARVPSERFANAGEFAAAIERFLGGIPERDPVAAHAKHSTTTWGRRALWMAAGAAAAMLIVALVWLMREQSPSTGTGPPARPTVAGALPAADGGPWISAAYYAQPGIPHVLELHPGSAEGKLSAWIIDWGEGELERISGEARFAQHAYAKDGRFKLRAWAVMAAGPTHAASTAGSPVHHWATSSGGNGHYYTATNVQGFWDTLLWESWSRGGYLVAIGSAAEQVFLNESFLSGSDSASAWYWIGLTEFPEHWIKGIDGRFRWDNDESRAFENWVVGRPRQNGLAIDSAAMNYLRVTGDISAPVGAWSELNDADVAGANGAPTGSMPAIIEFERVPANELEVVVYANSRERMPRWPRTFNSASTQPTTRGL